ncbi:site-2 protease family protein [Candidatus Woesebacteria bacterium]|nr:site-2 protease family protein [Candidatus Woesebacteria bacterium]|tara:strand:+ start:846 stop:1484 length:639 start_codon:yes stop_codon:yes gene_type:complete
MILILALAFLVAIVIHEFSHAWAADRLGDPTPRVQGRFSLNPIAHIDIIGTILVPAFLIISGAPILFGWAKPVRFDPYNLENPRRDAAKIAFAGPLSNLILATALALIVRGLDVFQVLPTLAVLLVPFIYINIILAIFNLIPIHPLDGGKILIALLPEDIAHSWDKILSQYGFIILLFLIFPIFGGTSIIFSIIRPVLNIILSTLLPTSPIL